MLKFFNGGIADSEKEGVRGSFYFGQKLNIFSEPTNLSILPAAAKNSGTTVVDLIKWIVPATPHNTSTYFIGDTGHIYSRTSAGVWADLRTVSNCLGQGLEVYDDYLYYTQNTQIGRYGTLSSSLTFTDNWQTGLNSTSATKFAPIKAFMNGLAVGHGDNLGWWDGSVWIGDRLTIHPGFQIRILDVVKEYLVIGAWKGTTITDCEKGMLYFWDGTSTAYNDFVEVPEGSISALLNSKNRLMTLPGSTGQIYLNTEPFQQAALIPKIAYSKYIDIYPGAVTTWKGRSMIGVAGGTDSADVVQGVYEWGTKSDRYSEVLNFSYPISTGTTTGTSLSIGAVKGIGDELYIGWKDNTTYGVDRVIQTASPYSSATYESNIFDDGRLAMDKLGISIKVSHLALVSGESIQIGYKINRASSYTTGTANSTVGSTETKLNIPSTTSRFKEIQIEVILATTGSTSPTVTSIIFSYDNLDIETAI